MRYLLFNSIEDAMERNDKAGADKGLPYHTGDGVTRYLWGSIEEEGGSNNRAVLEIDDPMGFLTTQEENQLLDDLPEDWQFPVD